MLVHLRVFHMAMHDTPAYLIFEQLENEAVLNISTVAGLVVEGTSGQVLLPAGNAERG